MNQEKEIQELRMSITNIKCRKCEGIDLYVVCSGSFDQQEVGCKSCGDRQYVPFEQLFLSDEEWNTLPKSEKIKRLEVIARFLEEENKRIAEIEKRTNISQKINQLKEILR